MKTLVCGASGLVRDALGELLGAHRGLGVVGPAGSAQEAIHLIASHAPDVILVTTTLPPTGGADAVRQILSRWPSARVVGLLVERSDVQRQGMMEAGALVCVALDEPTDRLVQVVRGAASGRGRWRESQAPASSARRGGPDRLAHEAGGLDELSGREREVLKLVAEGHAIREIAANLGLSPKTVDAHRRRVMGKLKVGNLADLTRLAVREGLVRP